MTTRPATVSAKPQSSSRKKVQLKDVPDVIIDQANSNRVFTRGRFLGKGGFARCYELIDNRSRAVYAGKVVSKLLLLKKHQKDKMTQEITIHKSLSHPHVVKMEGYFEDIDNVYILLELCSRRSLMELHKRRRAVTEPEARYFTHQIVNACIYLHNNKIIHRDLKLGNLFLNDDMQVKVGDFGLATTLDYDGERKRTLCGTPNYIAPEMLDKKGHSFEVDIWAIGCILFTLLVGKPPFETETLKDTYARIKSNQYVIPPRIGRNASSLIMCLLAPDPARRPRIGEILTTPFFTEGFLPQRLPTSCLTMAPKFNVQAVSGGSGDMRLLNNVLQDRNARSPSCQARLLPSVPETQAVKNVRQDAASVLVTGRAPGDQNDMPSDCYLSELYSQLTQLSNSNPDRFNEEDLVEVQDPASTPVYWVAKWVDYSDKYGLGYQLCDNSIGVLFNDTTKIILDAAGEQIQYTEKNNTEHYYVMSRYPPALEKKVTLLRYFRAYMSEHLLKTGANIPTREGDELARLPCLNTWFRTKSAIVLHLSNGILQVNFFHDHSKLIVCPLMGAATYIDEHKAVATYKFSLLERYGCPKELWTRLKYTKVMTERLMSRNANSVPGSLSTVNMRAQSQGGGRGVGGFNNGGQQPTTTGSTAPANF